MDMYTATELAYKNGYEKGYADGKTDVAKKIIEEISTYCTYDGSTKGDYVLGYYKAINKVLRGLVELKKKYTEGTNE